MPSSFQSTSHHHSSNKQNGEQKAQIQFKYRNYNIDNKNFITASPIDYAREDWVPGGLGWKYGVLL
jgi:hypothetical protein